MNNYEFTIWRVETRETTFKVKAKNADEAKAKAFELASDTDFQNKKFVEAHYELGAAKKLKV
jgi:hypothetical protein